MNKSITRGLALAAVTGGLTLLGVTAANAIDLPDLGGGDSVLDALRVDGGADVPVTVDGLNLSVLDPNDASSLLGDGVGASTGQAMADLFAQLGIDTSGVVDAGQLTSQAGIPVDVSNTWASVLGSGPSGVVVEPSASVPAFAWISSGADGFLDAFANAPVSISCTSVAVISDFENDCGDTTHIGTGTGGLLDGDLLDGDLDSEVPVGVSDQEVRVLDGETLELGTLGGDGILIDPADHVIDLSADAAADGQLAALGLPVDVTDAWVSILGENGGIVIVPDSMVDASLLTAGLVDSRTLAPVSIQCVTVTVLSDYDRDCADGQPADPGDLDTFPLPVEEDGVNGDGANPGPGNGDVCVAGTPTAADADTGADAGLVGGAAIAGALAGFGLMGIGRKLGII